MKQIILRAKCDYDKLYFLLKDNNFSESLISSLRHDNNSMNIDGEIANMRSRVLSGQEVAITIEDKVSSHIPFNDIPLNILFENEDLLIVNKPAGIPTIPSQRHFEDNLAGAVCKYMATKQSHFIFRALGRLDKDTSGVVIIAKNQYTATMAHIEKRYEALCNGTFPENQRQFDICAPIATIIENGINKQKRETSQNGKPATTHVKVIKNYDSYSHISLSLEQGRTHQIRVHLSSINHPLIGDSVYGEEHTSAPAERTLLHCAEAKITFSDASKSHISVRAPLPHDFLQFLNIETLK